MVDLTVGFDAESYALPSALSSALSSGYVSVDGQSEYVGYVSSLFTPEC